MAINNDEKNLLLGAGVLAIIYFGILKPITNKLGLTKDEKDRREENLIYEANKNPGWDPKFYKTIKKPIKIYKKETAITIAKQINSAWSFVNDDEQRIYAVFRSLPSQAALSQIAETYATLYKQDLLTRLQTPWHYLKDGLSESEFSVVANIVNKLPAYTS